MHFIYFCIVVIKKVQAHLYIMLSIYLLVVALLPLHQHSDHFSEDKHCEHTHTEDTHPHKHSTHDDCAICINLHLPYAINDFNPIELTIPFHYIYPSSIGMEFIFWIDVEGDLSRNKGPPFSIIS